MSDIKHDDNHQTVEVEPLPMTVHEMETEIKKITAIHSQNEEFLINANDHLRAKLEASQIRAANAIDLADKAVGLCQDINVELKEFQ